MWATCSIYFEHEKRSSILMHNSKNAFQMNKDKANLSLTRNPMHVYSQVSLFSPNGYRGADAIFHGPCISLETDKNIVELSMYLHE